MEIEPVAMSLEPRATLELRDTVQESITASVPGGVKVAVEGTEVVLTGTVSSDAERRLAELMAALEPGVRSIRNELVVEKPSK
jgi:osmotically-inducible protein OsmY